MTTNLTIHNPRLNAMGDRTDRFIAETFRTQSTTFETSDAKQVLNAANLRSGGKREKQWLVAPNSSGTRTGKALAGGTLSSAYPVNFVGERKQDKQDILGCAVLGLSKPGCAVPQIHDGRIGRQLSRSGGLAAIN